MSTSAEKKKAQTIDRSNNFYQRAGKRTSSSRFNSPDSKSTSSQISHTHIFEISVQNLVPMINKIKSQNEHMIAQKTKIETDMSKLNSLSNNLVKQNQALRRHYHQRSIDIQQLIQSITINTKQDISDINHLIFNYREQNGILAKNINKNDQEYKEIQQRINKLDQYLQSITIQNVNKQTILRKNQVKNQQINRKVNKLKTTAKTLVNLDGLQKEVCDLLVDVNLMKKRNIKTLRFLKQQRNQIQYDQPNMKYQTIQAIKGVKSLKNEIDRIKQDCRRMESKNSELQGNNNNILYKINQIQASNQGKRRKLANIMQKIKNNEQTIYKSISQSKNIAPRILQKRQMKQKLQKQLQQYQNNLQKMQNNHNACKSDLQISSSRQIQRIKQQISVTNKQIMDQLSASLIPIKKQQDQKISNLRYQLSVLNSRAAELQNMLGNMRNPLKDIMRMEYQMSRIGERQRI